MKRIAYFIRSPSRLNNLFRPHKIEDEVPYEIVKTICLSQMDYENFSTDLTVDREFIEYNAALCCIDDGVWKCLLIQQENTKKGILIMPEDQCWVGYAAYYMSTVNSAS